MKNNFVYYLIKEYIFSFTVTIDTNEYSTNAFAV